MIRESEIYIACPGYHKTGGTELLHQLYKALLSGGRNVTLVYYGPKAWRGINPAFKQYADSFISLGSCEAREGVLVVPETNVGLVRRCPRMSKAIWWLSVDNFLSQSSLKASWDAGKLKGMVNYLWNRPGDVSEAIGKANYHLCQSYYAKSFVTSLGIESSRVAMLSDYLNDIYTQNDCSLDASMRERRVLYNPRKGFEFTRKIIDAAPDLDWVPLEGLSNEEMRHLMQTSAVYIDFGNHPGKDRIPREAAASGCCVITGRRGAAANSIDIPIPESYKFSDNFDSIDGIRSQIMSCCNDYGSHIGHFEDYRQMIAAEKDVFYQAVDDVFEKDSQLH